MYILKDYVLLIYIIIIIIYYYMIFYARVLKLCKKSGGKFNI